MDFLLNPQVQIIGQLLLAAFLGGIVGLEREYNQIKKGLKDSYQLTLGLSTLFTLMLFILIILSVIIGENITNVQYVGFILFSLLLYVLCFFRYKMYVKRQQLIITKSGSSPFLIPYPPFKSNKAYLIK